MRPRYLRPLLFKNLVVLTALMAAFACSSGKPSDSQMPDKKGTDGVSATGTAASAGTGQYSIEIIPADATKRSMLSLIPKGFNFSEAKIEWLVDGVPVRGANAVTFNASQTKKGAVIQARVSSKGREIRSNEVVIKNSPPEITGGHFLLEGSTIAVDVTADDADDDSVALTYGWTVNDKPAGTGKTTTGTAPTAPPPAAESPIATAVADTKQAAVSTVTAVTGAVKTAESHLAAEQKAIETARRAIPSLQHGRRFGVAIAVAIALIAGTAVASGFSDPPPDAAGGARVVRDGDRRNAHAANIERLMAVERPHAQAAIGDAQPRQRKRQANRVENGAAGEHEVGALGADAGIGHALVEAHGHELGDDA